jgi:hypothetical protein
LKRRPLSRLVVTRALIEGAPAIGRAESAAVRLADRRLREFAAEAEILGHPVSVEITAPLVLMERRHYGSMTAEMTLEAAWSNRTDLPPDHQQALIGRGGIEIYGTAGPASATPPATARAAKPGTAPSRPGPTIREQGIFYSRRFRDWVAYTESSGHVSIDTRHIGFDLAMDSPAWGPSPAGTCCCRGAPSFGHAQARVALGDWFRYGMIVGSLRSGIIDSLRSYHPEESGPYFRTLERIKYLVAHRIDLRPMPRLNRTHRDGHHRRPFS